MATVAYVVDHALKDVLRRLSELTVAEPAYAVGLGAQSAGENLAVEFVAVGIEQDRAKCFDPANQSEAALSEAVYMAWNPFEFSIQESWRSRSQVDETFRVAEAEVREVLMARGIEDPQRYIYNRVAAEIDSARLEFPVTDDFVAFVCIDPDFFQTVENIRFSASPEALAILQSQDLLD
jgi:hypothetical protein